MPLRKKNRFHRTEFIYFAPDVIKSLRIQWGLDESCLILHRSQFSILCQKVFLSLNDKMLECDLLRYGGERIKSKIFTKTHEFPQERKQKKIGKAKMANTIYNRMVR